MTVFTAIFMIFFIFLTLLALLLKSIANILVSDLINSFFSLPSPIVSKNSVCRLFVRFPMKVKGPSVKFPSLFTSNIFSTSAFSIYCNKERELMSIILLFASSRHSISKSSICDIFFTIFGNFNPFSLMLFYFPDTEMYLSSGENHILYVTKTCLKLAN